MFVYLQTYRYIILMFFPGNGGESHLSETFLIGKRQQKSLNQFIF